jgi:hypothetical protein
MPIVFSAKLDGSEATRYYHVPLASFYLRQAALHASTAIQATEEEPKFKEALLAIIFSSLCLEAFANEMAETKLEGDELEDFFWLRGKYKNKGRGAGAAFKIKLLFDFHWSVDLSLQESPLREADELFSLRNELVHYKLTKAAGRAYMPQGETRITEGGGFVTTFDLMREPKRVEVPVVAKINERSAVDSYNAALRIIRRWNAEAGAPADELKSFSEM